jgi:SAM-dependent methyltransferase
MDILATHHETGVFWNEIAHWYGERDESESIDFLRRGGSYLHRHEQTLLGDLTPWCGRAIHLQCSHGNDALSLLRQGAAEVVGVDISERLLAVARRKTLALDAPATWHHCDVLLTPEDLNGTADLVYTGKGALCWMMDLDAWAAVAARLLKPGGRLFLYESHPLDWVWDTESQDYVLDQQYGNYFSEEFRERLFSETSATPRHRQWPLGRIVNTVIGSGLVLDQLNEHPEPFWGQFPNIPPETLHRLPHTFSLLAHKPEADDKTLK